ncbi:hypothetical protein BU26DRAFT_143311 [Trematosphaeria pertusa]|uniref:Carbohydrate-binding module family 13 protein n=1 Tax=Trematosphaeria pertusa TaxID=390896 RepID=A0A6A6IVU6_9PLEO|nr:uncharacterized protein BU26DRAFT_143311 [Trematosphaeria pertusa]KAF2254671.1 hypothetical protein BU26DRAFT_143311 [Trematosphaeria pertusa]
MGRKRLRRAVEGDFDSESFYTFHNTAMANLSLSSGIYQDTAGAINMTLEGSLSSENWQIYYQQGRYFIRNYDYGDYQLALTESSRSVPKLMKRSGELGHQWTLTRKDGDGWQLSNGLLGNGSLLCLNQAYTGTVPGMQPSEAGANWEILINPSAGSPKGSDLYRDVEGFEVRITERK